MTKVYSNTSTTSYLPRRRPNLKEGPVFLKPLYSGAILKPSAILAAARAVAFTHVTDAASHTPLVYGRWFLKNIATGIVNSDFYIIFFVCVFL